MEFKSYFVVKLFYIIVFTINLHETLGSIIKIEKRDVDYYLPNGNDPLLRSKRIAANTNGNRLWNQGVIPYQFEGNFTGKQFLLIEQAMQIWEKSTCVKFVPRIQNLHPKYVVIDKLSCGCCYYYDYSQLTRHRLSLNDGCYRLRIVLHELGHVIGLEHEHVRPDRDENIKIIEDNIKPEFINDFEKLSPAEIDTLSQPYDHESIMHYPQKAFAINKTMNTMVLLKKVDDRTPSIGYGKDLSEGDVIGTNLYYNCPVCGGTLTEPTGYFRSPNDSIDLFHRDYYCQWRISASQGEHVVLMITSFDLLESKDCDVDYLLIRDGYWNRSGSVRHCGSYISTIIWTQNYMLVDYAKKSHGTNNTGFVATYFKTCNFDIKLESNKSVTLESPNFPNDYEPYKECSWCLSVPQHHSISMKFNYFDIELSRGCINDYIRMKVLDRFKSWYLPRECGSKIGSKLIRSSKILIEFSSNEKIQRGGFSVTISANS